MITAQVIACLCVLVGLSMVAGWWAAFRNRPYLGLLGLSFLTLAVYLGVRQAVSAARDAGTVSPMMVWVQIGVLAVCIVLFGAATIAAVRESRRRLAEVREHFRAAEEGLMAMMEAERRRRAAQQDDDRPDNESENESDKESQP